MSPRITDNLVVAGAAAEGAELASYQVTVTTIKLIIV